MPSHVTDAKVKRISFVRRAATRDPRDPTQPRKVLLWKSEDAPTLPEIAPEGRPSVTLWKAADDVTPNERIDMPTAELEKRAIGREPTKPAASDGLLTLREIEDRQGQYGKLLAELDGDVKKMRRDPSTPPDVLHRQEEAHRGLAVAYQGLDAQRGLAEAHARAPMAKAEDSPIAKADIALRKADPSLSPLESLKLAIRSDPDGYFAQAGTARPAPATGRQLAKAEGDTYAEQSGAVERRAEVLAKSEGLRPSQAYARALAESGAYAGSGAAA